MPLLKGSCSCKKVKFSVESKTAYPFMLCYCSICRKTSGGGGYSINIMGIYETLKVEGEEYLSRYNAVIQGKKSPHTRFFCSQCGSHLWAHHPSYAENVYPVAGAIDTPLPEPPQKYHIMLGSKANWIEPSASKDDRIFEKYPDISILDYHKQHHLLDEDK